MDEEILNIGGDQRFLEERKKREDAIASLRKKYGKHENWPEIEKILWEDVGKKIRHTKRATDYLKSADAGEGEEGEDEDEDELLSILQKGSILKLSYYQVGMSREDLDKYNDLINELFTKRQLKNRKYFNDFLACDDMASIAKRAGCRKQYIQELFHKKTVEFVNSPKFVAITKDIIVKYRVAQEVKKEILAAAPEEMTLNGGSESFAHEDAWDMFEKGQIPHFDERAKKIEEEVGFELSGTLKDITPGKLKEMMFCGG